MFTDVIGDFRGWQVETVDPIAQTLNARLLGPEEFHRSYQHAKPQ